jgi:PEP-CTERM motif
MRTNVRSPSEVGGRPGFLLGKASLTLLLAVALTMTLGVSSASADSISYDLGVPNSGISSFPGPYGTVTVTTAGNSNTATITLTANTIGSNFYMFGGQGTIGVNTNGAATIVSGSIGGSNAGSGFSGPNLSDAGSGNEDGFGSFSNTVDNFDGYMWSATTVTFTLHKTTGTWANAADVLAANGSGYVAAGHVFVSDTKNFDSNPNFNAPTGFAANGSNPVPEPSTIALALSGVGLIGLGGVRRLLRRKALVATPA